MEQDILLDRLRGTIPTLAGILASVEESEAGWSPTPDRWSIRDVVNHLADEERVDFRKRLDLTLHYPELEWPGIDPERAIREPHYLDRSLKEAFDDFVAERERSLQWLRNLETPNWNATQTHPVFGSMQGGTLMASWLGHDLLHLHQIIKLRWEYLEKEVTPFRLDYAGVW